MDIGWNNAIAATDRKQGEGKYFFKPQDTYRVRWNLNTDTPLPQEEPGGQNPPDGAIIDFYLQNEVTTVTLEITDAKGSLVRKYTNNDQPYTIPPVNIPLYWIRPQQTLSGAAGHHRFTWDLRYTPLSGVVSYPIAAIYENTEPNPTAPFVMPGNYTVKLTADGKSFVQPIRILPDPRVKVLAGDLQLQHDLCFALYEGRRRILQLSAEINASRTTLTNKLQSQSSEQAQKYRSVADSLVTLQTGQTNGAIGLARLDNSFASLLDLLQDTDMPPTTQAINGAKENIAALKAFQLRWDKLKKEMPGISMNN